MRCEVRLGGILERAGKVGLATPVITQDIGASDKTRPSDLYDATDKTVNASSTVAANAIESPICFTQVHRSYRVAKTVVHRYLDV